MSDVYSNSQRTSVTSNAAASWEIIAGATRDVVIRELAITLAAATASTFAIGRPAAAGVTPTTPVLLQAQRPAARAALAATAVAWVTGPTVPAAFLARCTLPATAGATRRFVFSDGLYVPKGATLILWNLGAVSAADVDIVAEELGA